MVLYMLPKDNEPFILNLGFIVQCPRSSGLDELNDLRASLGRCLLINDLSLGLVQLEAVDPI